MTVIIEAVIMAVINDKRNGADATFLHSSLVSEVQGF